MVPQLKLLYRGLFQVAQPDLPPAGAGYKQGNNQHAQAKDNVDEADVVDQKAAEAFDHLSGVLREKQQQHAASRTIAAKGKIVRLQSMRPSGFFCLIS